MYRPVVWSEDDVQSLLECYVERAFVRTQPVQRVLFAQRKNYPDEVLKEKQP